MLTLAEPHESASWPESPQNLPRIVWGPSSSSPIRLTVGKLGKTSMPFFFELLSGGPR